MKVATHVKILLGWIAFTLASAYVGWYLPAAISFVLYVLWTIVRNATGHHPQRGHRTKHRPAPVVKTTRT
jgi:hypothetical protein